MAMPQNREGAFNPASPLSSSGVADSFKSTPNTRLTAFSPGDGSTKSLRVHHSLGFGGRESGPVKFTMASPVSLDLPITKRSFYNSSYQLEKDPFVTSSGSGTNSNAGLTIKQPVQSQLSPTASSFSPYISGPASGRRPEASISRAPSAAFVHPELSTDMGLSRCVMVSVIGQRLQTADVEQYIMRLTSEGLKFEGVRQLRGSGERVYVRFSNIRDACLFTQNASLGGPDWDIRPIRAHEFSQKVDPTSGIVTEHEGQIYISVFGSPGRLTEFGPLKDMVQDVLLAEGDLFAFRVQPLGVEESLLNAVVEFCDNDVSLSVVTKLNGHVVHDLHFCMTVHRPDMPCTINSLDRIVSPARSATTGMSDMTNDFQNMSMSSRAMLSTPLSTPMGTPARGFHPGFHTAPPAYGIPLMPVSPMFQDMSPRGHGYVHHGYGHHGYGGPQVPFPAGNYTFAAPLMPQPYISAEYMTPRHCGFPRHDGRRQYATRVSRAPPYHNAAGQHNHVDVNRIREGIDVRTTIMLRNIPNKVDQAMLKRIVDESSWGKYDFMYLRIDFANDCNVGYAFINFVDPLDIIDFVNARGNQRWNCFKSDKVAEISYATIQGKDCLVQKFRNSSVMLEAPHYRPKLYFTSNGPVPELAGTEEPFPEPDNQSKMKRSCENAEHVGLFTPNAGQHFRDEQRRRRSQYDRGTRLAALEEYDFESAAHRPFYSPRLPPPQ